MNTRLKDFIEEITKKSQATDAPIIISVAGGSCTGKSTFVNELVKAFDDVQILHQDDYQLGTIFNSKKTSKYKWDDPENFQIKRSFDDLSKFIKKETITIPAFDLKQNTNLGTKTIYVKKINIFEGIYTLLPPLNSIIFSSLYIEVPYYVRFLRRIHRFIISKQNEDISIPVRQMATSVLLAHKDYVIQQKQNATLVFYGDETIPIFPEKKSFILVGEKYKILFTDKIFQILIYNENEKKYLSITQNNIVVYFEIISEEVAQSLERLDWMEL